MSKSDVLAVYATIILLCGCVAFLGWRLWQGNAMVQAARSAASPIADAHPLRLPDTIAAPDQPAMYFVFAPDACPYCLEEIAVINDVHASYGDRLMVQGIVLTDDPSDLERVRSTWDIRFPLVADKRWVGLGGLRTPYKLAVNRDGRILYYAGPFPDPLSHEATRTHLMAIATELAGRS